MNPEEEKELLERTLELSEDNNEILKKLDKRARWVFIWGFIKIIIIILPLVVGYFLLQPYLDQALQGYSGVQELLKNI